MMEHNDRSRFDDGRDARVESGRGGPSAALIAAIVLVVALLIFVVRNGDDAAVDFVFTDVQLPLWIVMAIAVGVGILIDRLVLFWWRRGRRGRDD
jgi:uncharacterized integral membrane protein